MDSAVDAVVGFVATFIIVRLCNFVFNNVLLCASKAATGVKVLTLVLLLILYLGAHGICIFVTLEMIDSDFIGWTIAFFGAYIIDLIVWELIVTFWQLSAVKKLRESK
jgi:hypothetical protein